MSAPSDILLLASRLAQEDVEASWQSAVSRAYYSCFHAAKIWHDSLPRPGDPQTARGEHETLIRQLTLPHRDCDPAQIALSRWLAGQLFNLRAERVVADYKLSEPMSKERALNACATAQLVLEAIVTGRRP